MCKRVLFIVIGICYSLFLNAQVSKSLNIIAGSLSSVLSEAELQTVTNLTLTGTIDGRDFITMRDNMPLLETLDLSGVSISEYFGDGGIIYNANAVPYNSFDIQNVTGKIRLKAVVLPSSIISIGNGAFTNCSGLTSINIPASVTSIGRFAFQNCSSLTSIDIPIWLTSIGELAFDKCSAFFRVDVNNPIYYSVDGILYNKARTNLNLIKNWNFTTDLTNWDYYAETSIAGQINPIIENGVVSMTTGIDPNAYYWNYQFTQTGLKALPNVEYILIFKSWSSKLRSNVLDFEDSAYNRIGASSDPESINGRSEWIYYTSTEPKWYTFHVVFDQISPTTVQKIQWMLATANATTYLDSVILVVDNGGCYLEPYFDLTLSANHVNMPETEASATVNITSNTDWEVHSNQAWLTVNSGNGTGNQTLNLNALENPSNASRTAILIVSSIGLESQTITVTQESTTGIDPILDDQKLLLYPNPTSGKVKIVLTQNPQRGTYLIVSDLTGRTILKQFIQDKEEWIDLEGHSPGIYFIKTNIENLKVQKVILK